MAFLNTILIVIILNFLKRGPSRRLVYFLGIALILTAIPVTVFMSQQQQETRQRASIDNICSFKFGDEKSCVGFYKKPCIEDYEGKWNCENNTVNTTRGTTRQQIKRTFALTGGVFNDLNANGNWDAGEPGISGINVSVSGSGNYSSSTLSQADKFGTYRFFLPSSGTYTAGIEVPTEYKITTKNDVRFGSFGSNMLKAIDFGITKIQTITPTPAIKITEIPTPPPGTCGNKICDSNEIKNLCPGEVVAAIKTVCPQDCGYKSCTIKGIQKPTYPPDRY